MRVKPLAKAPRDDGEMVYREKAKDECSWDGKCNEMQPNATELKVCRSYPLLTSPTKATARPRWYSAYE